MRLIQTIVEATTGAAAGILTLDGVWREAEALGRINVETSMYGDRTYKASIRFTNAGGSTIWANGSHPDIVDAVMPAIREARRLA